MSTRSGSWIYSFRELPDESSAATCSCPHARGLRHAFIAAGRFSNLPLGDLARRRRSRAGGNPRARVFYAVVDRSSRRPARRVSSGRRKRDVLFVLAGVRATTDTEGADGNLTDGSFALLLPKDGVTITAATPLCALALTKKYQPTPGYEFVVGYVGHSSDVPKIVWAENPDSLLQTPFLTTRLRRHGRHQRRRLKQAGRCWSGRNSSPVSMN